MDLFADLTANRLLISRSATTTLDRLRVHQNDEYTLSLWLLEQTGISTAPYTVVALPAEFTGINLGARSADNLEETDLLFSATLWTPAGADQTLHYDVDLSLKTASISAKFPEENLTKRTLDALLDLELVNADGTKCRTIAPQWPVTITRDIFRGTESVPATGNPEGRLYRVTGDGRFQLWNKTREIWQTIWLEGALGAEALVIGHGEYILVDLVASIAKTSVDTFWQWEYTPGGDAEADVPLTGDTVRDQAGRTGTVAGSHEVGAGVFAFITLKTDAFNPGLVGTGQIIVLAQ